MSVTEHYHQESPAGPVVDEVRIVPTPPPSAVVRPVVQVVESAPAVVPTVMPATTVYRSRRFLPDAIVAGSVGVVLLVTGLVAIARGGFEGSLSEPRFEVMGFGHTTALGLIEILFGLALLGSGVAASRSSATFFGSVLGIAAFVGAVQTESFRRSLGLESGYAWLVCLLGLLVVGSALLLPRMTARTTSYEPTTAVVERRW